MKNSQLQEQIDQLDLQRETVEVSIKLKVQEDKRTGSAQKAPAVKFAVEDEDDDPFAYNEEVDGPAGPAKIAEDEANSNPWNKKKTTPIMKIYMERIATKADPRLLVVPNVAMMKKRSNSCTEGIEKAVKQKLTGKVNVYNFDMKKYQKERCEDRVMSQQKQHNQPIDVSN